MEECIIMQDSCHNEHRVDMTETLSNTCMPSPATSSVDPSYVRDIVDKINFANVASPVGSCVGDHVNVDTMEISSNSSKTSKDQSTLLIKVEPDNGSVTSEEACLGLVKAILYLENRHNIEDDYVNLLWKVLKHIDQYSDVQYRFVIESSASCMDPNLRETRKMVMINKNIHVVERSLVDILSNVANDDPTVDITLKEETIDTEDSEHKYSDSDIMNNVFMANDGNSVSKDVSSIDSNEDTENTDHMKQHEASQTQNLHSCDVCGRLFKSSYNLKRHMKTHSSMKQVHSSDKPHETHSLEKQLLRCKKCDREFTSKRMLHRHVKTHNESRTFTCTVCDVEFSCSEQLTDHKRTHTKQKLKNTDIPLECIQCNKIFANSCKLRKHMYTHTVASLFCIHCGKAFKHMTKLRRHEILHSDVKPFKCPDCEKCFHSAEYLKRHSAIHLAGEKQFACNMCNKHFAVKYKLTKHMKNHTVERRHACKLCDKIFINPSHLRMHMNIHTGQRLHQCEECGKGFNSKCN